MISHLSGDVIDITPTSLVISVSGVGFQVLCTPDTSARFQVGDSARLHTHLAVREDALTLYGFSSTEEREAFLLCQSVSGIGAKLALAIIAHMSAGQLRQAVLSENLVALSKVPGVGKKTAQRLVLELKDKVLGLSDTAEDLVPQETQRMDQVKLGLQGLGYSPKDSDLAWAAIEELASDPSTSISALMKAALQSLAKA